MVFRPKIGAEVANNEFSKFLNQFPTKQFGENDVLLIPGKNPSSLFYLIRGHIRLFSTSEQGKELTLHIFERESIFPLNWAINNINQEYGLQAVTKAKAILVPKDKFVTFLKKHPTTLYKYTQNLVKGIDGLTKRVEIVSMDNAQKRVRSALIYLSKHFSTNKDNKVVMKYHFTHEDISMLTGLTRERVSVEMKKLKDKGVIDYNHSSLTVLYPDKLLL